MGSLSYTATVSLDGYVVDADGDFQWSGPDDEVFRFHVERMGPISHEILGRKTYELMRYWYADPDTEDWGPTNGSSPGAGGTSATSRSPRP